MTIQEVLNSIGLPVAYSHFKQKQKLPFIVYVGNGQEQFVADNNFYYKQNSYRIEFYYKNKNEKIEEKIEKALCESGYLYEKSKDIYIDSENVFVIYYYV